MSDFSAALRPVIDAVDGLFPAANHDWTYGIGLKSATETPFSLMNMRFETA